MLTEPKLVADVPCETGENPLWHPDEELVYWCDIPKGYLYAYDPETGNHERVHDSNEPLGGFTIQEDGSLLLFQDAGAVRRFDDGRTEVVVEPNPDEFHERFNDVIADPEGRVFCGVMPGTGADLPGALFRLDVDGTFTRVIDEVNLPNGMGFTPDLKQMYVTDTCGTVSTPGHIMRYDYDRATGEISSPELFLEPTDIEGMPDGMTVDNSGDVWSAFWDGHKLVRYDDGGTRKQVIQFKPEKVSSITFGGDDYAEAYVTTAGGPNRETEGAMAGSLFRLDLGVRGREEFRSAIEV